ncbi:hypothetical protein C3941_17880 [Kaistia algarum]|uniref:AraD1 family protein n=1 Tax=Kaistia algarum TaxID=2083279 RepID=UPI000CE79D24|nr:AraD1 family protein [Kaistia algarum]MCX5516743.1 GguC family protein [Kaistia algarum]PPE78636.1 hypothetical protein C3941_17880 [Kaistia algarum]
MRLVQFLGTGDERRVAALVDGAKSYRAVAAESVRGLALDAHSAGQSLAEHVRDRLRVEEVDVETLHRERRLLLPLDHPEPSRVTIGITGLTHLGSAQQRDAMHAKMQAETLSDSMKMFKLGVEGGKPAPGEIGVQPEWAYKGDGDWMVPPGAPIEQPDYAEDGGEEAEIVGLYVIADDGTVLRVGYALGNEYSDHVMERRNYLYLAHSKLRQCSFGPELLVGELPQDVHGRVSILRQDQAVWSSPFLSGEANMSHSISNLERHHFKYSGFRRAGDVHVYFYGAGILSFGEVVLQAGDICKVESPLFGLPLVNPIVKGTRTEPTILAL